MSHVLEFKTILAELNNPYKEKESFVFKFSSIDSIKQLNHTFKTIFEIQLSFDIIPLNSKEYEMPKKLSDLLPIVTQKVIKSLEKDYKIIKTDENNTTTNLLMLIEGFIYKYGINTTQVYLFYDELNNI